jgi:TetR/AcrR family transcriptional regulator, transcriptional repressor for nem operon
VDAAKDVFWQRGYAATSMRELKDELGVLPGSLYGAFGDKHALFLRALERYADGARGTAAALIGHGPVLPRIRALLADALMAASISPGRGCMLGNTAAELLPHDEAARQVISTAFGALESAIEQALAIARHNGEIRQDIDCGTQARLLVALLQGLHILARAEPDPHRLDDVVHAALAPLEPRRPRAAKGARKTGQSDR